MQAAISAVHSEAKEYDQTNWSEIILLYDEIYKIQPSPVIKLNRLVALSYVEALPAVLKQLDHLQENFHDYQPFYAAKADICRRSNLIQQAAENYLKAISLSGNDKEKAFLQRRLAEIKL